MPSSIIDDGLCVDCQAQKPAAVIRNRGLCSDCVLRYVRSKVLKRMESYRFKQIDGDQRQKLLLPLSGGLSSLLLLHVLDGQLRRQRETRKWTSYDLVVVHAGTDEVMTTGTPEWYEEVKRRYPDHEFLDIASLSEVCRLDGNFENDVKHLGLHRRPSEPDDCFIERLLGSPKTITARADMLALIVHRLIIKLARQNGCDGILWGHSTSRLAAKALAGVAKGRGTSLHLDTADGQFQDGLTFNYPLRDLSKGELVLYAKLQPEDFTANSTLEDDSASPQRSVRDMSIDELLTSYVAEQSTKYTNIMANVIRTVGKLQTLAPTKAARICTFCRTSYNGDASQCQTENMLCYGCSRLKKDIPLITNG